MAKQDKTRETLVCQLVADEVNKVRGTDYHAVAVAEEPPDVRLESASGIHAARDCEVVSAPFDFTIRYDNDNVRNLETNLRVALERCGFSGYRVGIHWTDAVRQHSIKGGLDELASLIAASVPLSGHVFRRGVEIWEDSPRVARQVNYFSVFRLSDNRLEIHSTASWWAPADGRWIAEAVSAKIKRYGIGAYAATLTLVVDGLAYLDAEQLTAYRATVPSAQIPFAELWAVTMGKAYQLKANE